MRRTLRFTTGLVAALGLLTWGAALIVHQTTADWFESDLRLRAQLAVTGARRALVSSWGPASTRELRLVLSELTHDERILAAAACTTGLTLLAQTPDYPAHLDCKSIGRHVRAASDGTAAEWTPWHTTMTLEGGNLHLSAIPLVEGDQPLGFVVLAHDLSYIERRDAKMREFLLVAFGVLALATAVVTLVAARWSWAGWSSELRRLLKGDTDRPEFRPFVRDVWEFVDRILTETERDREAGLWTPERLKHALTRYLHGEKIVIVANREPYIHERAGDGHVTVVHPASGLVTALEPVMRACSGVWIAHGSGSADRETVDAHDRVAVPPGEESYFIRRLWLNAEEERGYYYGFSNEGLWPLCHLAHARPLFRRDDWEAYQTVNRRFADAVCAEVDSDDPIVLVQDYHFALAPALIRERLPRATIIMFWHIPWPNAERMGICPWRNALLEGMLGSSILGFHTQSHCNNFTDSADRFLEARIDRERNAVVRGGRASLVRPYPISIEWPPHWIRTAPSADECRASVINELGLRPDALIGVGVDRLDYTKGVEERLLAVERLLEHLPELRGRFTFVQLAAPSRAIIERYRQLNEDVEGLARRINDRFGDGVYRPIVLRRAHHEPPAVFRFYRAADVCYVSSLHDGMNLVAKEFVGSRDDEHGVLVLSQFTGAARELTEALIVNPYDLDESSAALAAALAMSAGEQRDRMRAMRALIAEFNVYRWAGQMIADAAQLRNHDRLTGRLTDHLVASPADAAL